MRDRLVAIICAMLAGAGVAGCDDDALGQATEDAAIDNVCTTLGQNHFVKNTMDEWYLYRQQMPDPAPENFDSPRAFLSALQVNPPDRFSFINDLEANERFFEESQFIGIGFSARVLDNSTYRLSQVFPDSPADRAGLARGYDIVAVNGISVEQLLANDRLNEELGPSEEGVEVDLTWEDLDGVRHNAAVTKEIVTIPTVSFTNVYQTGGKTVGYLVFRNFVEPSIEALDEAFSDFRAQGIDELVLDMRYNGGGRVNVARFLGSLIGGDTAAGALFARFEHNDQKRGENQTLEFSSPQNALGLDRLIVIGTGQTASASELVINSLRPFIPVVLVGDNTFGKPVGSYTFEFCDKALHPIAFRILNANDAGRYFDGFAPNCPANDELVEPFGSTTEDSLQEALHYAANDSCSSSSAKVVTGVEKTSAVTQPYERDGWAQVTGGVQ